MRIARPPSGLCAIGECGLDFGRAKEPEQRAHQVAAFRGHLDLARETGMPLTIHCVHAHAVMLELLRERPTPPAAMHAFSGSAEVARQLVSAGHYVSFAGNLTLHGARKVVEAARAVPIDRLLIETDSPDQTPVERRPRPNEPAFIVDVAKRLSDVRGETLQHIADHTRANACRLFRVDEPLSLCEFPGDLGPDVDRLLIEDGDPEQDSPA